MGFLTGSGNSWQPVRTSNTTTKSYWLNWRVLLCSIWVITSLVFSYLLISKYEGLRRTRTRRENMAGENEQEDCGMLYEDEVWMPCLKEIHPRWLLAFRLFAFFVLLTLLILNVTADGADILYYYTQWTFTLVIIYFGLGSALSIYGCHRHHTRVVGKGVDVESDTYSHAHENGELDYDRQVGGFWAYLFQMIFQMNAGAVILTDTVFWFILFPYLEINKQYDLNVLVVSMHTINAIFLLGDTALNCLRFPWFRMAYFFLWTAFYVIFQWLVHACIFLWWPYPFLDLSDSFAPLWYSLIALMHVPCYAMFMLIMKLKYFIFSKWFPNSYRGVKY